MKFWWVFRWCECFFWYSRDPSILQKQHSNLQLQSSNFTFWRLQDIRPELLCMRNPQRQFRSIINTKSKEANLGCVCTSHCVRATTIQALNDANVELRHIKYMSEHEASYTRGCTGEQIRELSKMLNHSLRPDCFKFPRSGHILQYIFNIAMTFWDVSWSPPLTLLS